jgi:pimeloyl-ACP methyl ester carboxylesterase
MVRFFRASGLPSRRAREAARRRRRSDRERDLKLEPRLALAVMPGLPDTVPPVVRSVALPAAGTYGTGKPLTFKVNFNEPVKVVGDQNAVTLPVEVGYAMHEARYVSGSGTKSLTFRMTVAANDVDTDGISLGRVNADAVRDFDFAAECIQDRAGNPASNTIPAVNTSRIRVDATGPVVASYGAFVTRGQQVSLKVIFDGPVTVKGKPTIPVTIGGQDRSLTYASGSGTKTLTFAVTLPRRSSTANPVFRGENGLPGEVIVLPAGADLKDRFGNSVTAVGGNFGKTFTHAGSRVVVIGTHFEKLGTLSKDDLDTILSEEQKGYRKDEAELIDKGKAEYWKNYVPPVFNPVSSDVDVYRVAYRSMIPEQGNRPTVAYGLLAIPKGATGTLPLVSYQHGMRWLKESGPSQAFSWDKTENTTPVRYGLTQKQLYDMNFDTRLNVAQFAGHGYAVIAADLFGLGNSLENDAFWVKQSEQQACLDMYAASQKLFKSLNVSTDKLFLSGASQGGLVTLAFQEALEARGVKITGVSTAVASSDMEMFANRMIFNPRPYSTTTVPDAASNVSILQFSAFSLGEYGGKPGTALELFGGNYDFARKFYRREFSTLPTFTFQTDVQGSTVPVMTMDGVTLTAEPAKFIDQRFGSDPRAYGKTAFAGLFRDAGAGKTRRLDSEMRMYYSAADQVAPVAVSTIIDTWQRGTFGKTNLVMESVPDASHRDAILTAASRQLEWFDIKRSALPRLDVLPPAPPSVFSPNGEPLLGTYAGSFGTVELTSRLSPLQYSQLKKWFFGTFSSNGLLAGFAVVDAGYGSTAFVYVVDLAKGTSLVDRGEIGLPLVSTVINGNPGAGARATFANGIGGSLSVSITRGAESTPFRVEIVSKDDDLRIDATLDPSGAPLPVSTLVPAPPGDIYATVKRPLLPVTGSLQLGSRAWNLAEGFRGGFDYTQGILPSHTVWNWAFLQGTADDGTAVGLNLTGGIVPDGRTADNALWAGKELSTLGKPMFTFNRQNFMDPWEVTTADDRIHLQFTPKGSHTENRNLGLVNSRFIQVAGVFNGTIRTAEGRVLTLTNVPGVLEDQDVWW